MKPKTYNQFIHFMKLSLGQLFLIALFGNLSFAHVSSGQKAKSVFKVDFEVSESNVPVEEVFNQIVSETPFRLAYDKAILGTDKVSVNETNLGEALVSISRQTGLRFRQVNEIIAVSVDLKAKKKPVEVLIYTKELQGKVTDGETGEPLPGAAVKVKGSAIGTITDVDGNFTLTVPDDAQTLVVSYIGFTTTEITIGDRTIFDIALSPDVTALEEVVVIGYGTVAKRDLTGSVATVSGEDIGPQPNVGFDQNLAGRLPGVNIQQTTGTPGGNVSIRIRGTGSISAGNEPLIVIDGYPLSDGYTSSTVQGSRPSNATRRENPQNPLNSLNPNDIESIEVLKDASAAAIYGSRGANGVIIITTKKGAEGKAKFNYNGYYGVQRIITTYDMMDAYEFAEQNYNARLNGGTEGGYPAEFIPYLNDEPGLVSTDWQDALFRDAAIQSHDLSASGGSENLKYYVSGNYFSQEGIILGSGFERFSLRSNLEGQLTDKIKLSVNLNPSVTQSDLVPAENPYFVDGVVNLALLAIPTDPIYNEDGSFNFNQNTAAGSGPFVNPIALAEGVEDNLEQVRMLGNMRLEAEIIEGLQFTTSFGVDINSFQRDYYRPSWIPVRGAQLPSDPNGRNFTTDITNWVNENTLAYSKEFNDHSLNFLVGFSAQKERIVRTGILANNFPNDLVTTLNAGIVTSGFSQVQEWSLLSYFSRAIYDYKGKYLVNLSVRRDGSSRFGNDTKWGVFPSASVGWRVSNESFFPETELLSDLKFRVSYGQTGNFSIPNYGAIALLESADYVLNNQQVNGLAPDTSPNSDLSWEKTTMTNFGLDIGLFDDKIFLTSDYFISNTEDLLINLPVPGTSGFSTSLQNIGEVRNTGFELGLTGYFEFGDLKWSANANIATLTNEVISLGQSNEPIITSGGVPNTHITQVGSPIGSYYGYSVLGVFMNEEELNSYPSLSDTRVGDFQFEDVNGDGSITPEDRTIIGDFFPDYTFGFSSQFEYKNIDFNFLVQGSQGFEVFHLAQRYLGSLQTFSNYRADIYNQTFFSEDDPGSGQVYRPNSSPTGDNDAISSYHVEDGSYVRLRSVSLGYTFRDQPFFQKLPFDSFRVYLTGQNLFTITDYPGYNPEVNMRPEDPLSQGEDYGTYPLAKSVIFGVNLTF